MHQAMNPIFQKTAKNKSKDEADKVFQALSAGGKIIMPMEDAFWGGYFGTFTDKFGVNWMINFEKNQGE